MNVTVAGVHPAAEIFPLLTGTEAETLTKDIAANGLREKIVLTDDRLVLDGRNRLAACDAAGVGRNRLAACDAAGVEPRFETWDGNGSPVDYVVSKNLHRRHLDVGQRAMVAVDLIPLYEAEARERMLAGRAADPSLEIGQGHGKAAAKAAAVVNVSRSSVENAKALAVESPERAAEVRAGKKKLGRAVAETKREQLRAAPAPAFPDGVFPGRPRRAPGGCRASRRAYVFAPSRRCYLIPFPALRRAWTNLGDRWVTDYPRAEARNEGYTTVSVAVPRDEFLNTVCCRLAVHTGRTWVRLAC